MKKLKNKSSRDIFEYISDCCYSSIVPLKYGKNEKKLSLKYINAKINTYEWINNLTYYYMKKEENLNNELIFNLELKKKEIDILKKGDYKEGIKDTLNEILEELK